MGFIYKISNDINNCVYIGQTRRKVSYRFKEHLRMAKNLFEEQKHLTHFQKKIIEYGPEHFKVEIIEECEDKILDEREIYWIKYYDSFWHGYNSTFGGQTSEYPKAQMVIQYNINGEYIHLFKNVHEATTAVNVNEGSIRNACTQKIQTSAGYQWRYYTQNFPTQINSVNLMHKKGGIKAVIQYDLYGKEINRFSSIEEAANATNINRSNISRACKTEGVSKAGGFQWRFVNSKDVPIALKDTESKKTKKIPKTAYPVSQYTKEYDFIKDWGTIREAADALKIRSSLIINNCEKKQQTAGGYVWIYKNLT